MAYKSHNQRQINQLDNSSSFKKTFDTLLNHQFLSPNKNKQFYTQKQQNQQQQSNFKTQNFQTIDPKNLDPTYRKTDPLNQWSYCDPKNNEDQLPQPYRFIDKCLQDMILKPVYNQIFEIEKYKQNPNYEGQVKEICPQGNLNLDGITCLHKYKNYTYNHMYAGDKYGSIHLMDMSRRQQIASEQVISGKRIQHINTVTLSYADQFLSTIAVISRAHNYVLIYRLLSNEEKFYLHYKIKITEEYNENSTIGEFPYEAHISDDGEFIKISKYNGDLVMYKIPDPPKPILEEQNLEQQQLLNLPNQVLPQTTQNIQRLTTMSLEQEVQELDEVFYSIKFQGQPIYQDYDDYLLKLKQESEKLLSQDQQQQDSKDAKKDSKKPGKGQPAPKQQQQEAPKETEENEQSQIEFNNNDKFPEYQYTELNGDYSENPPVPKYKPISYFVQSSITITDPEKIFNKTREVHLTTHLIVIWTNTKFFEYHFLQPKKAEYLSQYVYDIYFSDPQYPDKQKVMKSAQAFFPPKLDKKFDLLYSISETAISQNQNQLAIGMSNGTIVIWDLLLNSEKWYLDKHLQKVTALQFFENFKLISGSEDGGIHIYNLEKGKIEMKRTHLFREEKEYSIKNISISPVGVAFAIDSLNNLRMYDMFHSDKIAKLSLKNQFYDCKPKQFINEPQVIMDAQKEQLTIICEIQHIQNEKQIIQTSLSQISNNDEEQKQIENENDPNLELKIQDEENQNNPFLKKTNLFIFRIQDAFLNIFPGFASIYNKIGLDMEKKHQIINVFGKLSMEDLKDPNFELPQLGGPNKNLILQINNNKNNVTKSALRSSQKKSQDFMSAMGQSSNSLQGTQKSIQFNTQQQNPIKNGKQSQRTIQDSYLPQTNTNYFKQSFGLLKNQNLDISLNESFKTQATHVSGNKNTINLKSMQNKGKLTKEILHPEEALLEKMVYPTETLNDGLKQTIEGSRLRAQYKNQREKKVERRINQISKELQLKQERTILEQKKRMLSNK